MGVFNYSKLHYFDKNGNELILNHYPDVRFRIYNHSHPEFPADYAFVNSTPDLDNIPGNSSILPISTGMRFGLTDGTDRLDVSTYIKDSSANQEYIGDAAIWNSAGSQKFSIHEYQSSFGVQNYPDLLYNDTSDAVREQFLKNLAIDSSVNFFPTYSFKSRMEFERVSTELIETQTVYVLVENEFAEDNHGRKQYTTLSEYIDFGNEFKVERSEIQSKIDQIENYYKPESDRLAEEIREGEEAGINVCDLVFQKDAVDMEINSESDLINRRNDLDKKISKCDDVAAYIRRFKLFFFIDGRDQKDFRFFNTRYDELTWSDRSVIDFTKKFNIENSDNGYSVNIGFSGEFDGVYQQPMYVCLLDTFNTENSEIGEAYPIGEIMLNAEAEGEDERYRTFFTNFGIPDPKEYNDIFSDTDINDDLPDYVSINKKSKQLFLSYNEIFPYIGSYKALLNAIKYLGYDDIFFKEWYKEIGDSAMDDSGYTTYEITYGNDSKRNTIETLDVSERIHLRKMNWVSMLYRLNQELNIPENKFGFPTAITNVENYNTERLPKLISLKNWIDRYATGVNCRVIDISGEGLVFERYNLQKWGSYQRVIEYINEKAISPVPANTAYTLIDGSANIDVDIYTNDQIFTIEELQDTTFLDYCEGYFDENKKFVECEDSSIKDNQNYRYFGKTFELNDNMNSFQLRLKGTHDTYRFGYDFIHGDSMSLLVDNDSVIFDYTYSTSKHRNAIFTKLPVIQIEEGVIKRYKQNDEPKGTYAYIMKIYSNNGSDSYSLDVTSHETGVDSSIYYVSTVPSFMPPTISGSGTTRTMKSRSKMLDPTKGYSMTGNTTNAYEGGSGTSVQRHNGSFGLRYCTDNVNGIPCFKIVGYEEKHLWDDNGISLPLLKDDKGYEYIVEIKNGRMLFNDDSNDITVSLNFSYDENTSHQNIYVTTFKTSNGSTLYNYKIGQGDDEYTSRFKNGQSYEYFVNMYDIEPSNVISYNNRKSISVNHTGTYQVDAILYDRFNNIFSKTSDTKVNVLPSYTDIKLYITESKSGNTDGKLNGNQTAINSLVGSFQIYIFGYTPKLRITDVINDGVLKFGGKDSGDTFQDDGTTLSFNKVDYDVANISSLSDRLDLSSGNGDVYTFVRKSTHKSHLTPEDNRYGDIEYSNEYVEHAFEDSGIIMSGNIDTDLARCYNTYTDITKGCMFNGILIVYDDILEMINMNVLCTYLPYKAYGDSVYDQYKIKINSSLNLLTNNSNDSRYSFYLIPRWCVKLNEISIHDDGSNNYVDFNTDINNRYFCRSIDKNSSVYVYYRESNTYHGYGLYKQISDDEEDTVVEPFSSDNDYGNSVSKFRTYSKIWFSSGDVEYETHPCSIVKEESDTSKQYVKLMDNDVLRGTTRFVDSQYSVSFRNFNPEDAKEMWKGSGIDVSRKYEYNVPVSTKNNTVYVAVTVDKLYNTVSKLSNNDVTVRWRVYKRIGLIERKMVMECYNKVLSMNLNHYGKYDIEVEVFDKYGNKYNKEMGGALTYNK